MQCSKGGSSNKLPIAMITECAECAVKHDCFKLPPLQNYPLLGGGNNLFLVGDIHV